MAILLTLALSLAAARDASAPERVALLELQSNPAAAADIAAVSALLASRLSATPQLRVVTQQDLAQAITVEKQRQMLGQECDSGCAAELTGAVGARYLVSGRLDRLGDNYLLTTTLFDSRRAVAVAKPSAQVQTADELPSAVDQVAAQLHQALGVSGGTVQRNVSVALKVGNMFFGLRALNPAGDLEVGLRFLPQVVGFVQVGFTFVRTDVSSGVSLLPSVLGIRRTFRPNHPFQPYAGGALGVQLALGRYGVFRETHAVPTLIGLGGLEYLVTPAFVLGVEASTNVGQALLGLGKQQIASGLNADVSFTVGYRL